MTAQKTITFEEVFNKFAGCVAILSSVSLIIAVFYAAGYSIFFGLSTFDLFYLSDIIDLAIRIAPIATIFVLIQILGFFSIPVTRPDVPHLRSRKWIMTAHFRWFVLMYILFMMPWFFQGYTKEFPFILGFALFSPFIFLYYFNKTLEDFHLVASSALEKFIFSIALGCSACILLGFLAAQQEITSDEFYTVQITDNTELKRVTHIREMGGFVMFYSTATQIIYLVDRDSIVLMERQSAKRDARTPACRYIGIC